MDAVGSFQFKIIFQILLYFNALPILLETMVFIHSEQNVTGRYKSVSQMSISQFPCLLILFY